MRVYNSIDEFEPIQGAVVTTGTFDGVHIGHNTIINRLKEVARRINGETVLLTFFPHPRKVLQPNMDLYLLNTQEEKIKLLEAAGIDHLIIHPFTMEFSRLKSLDFVRDILVNKMATKKLVIGYDHHFGRNRQGSFDHLKEYGPLYGFDVEEIPAKDIENVAVSSTKIRSALAEGDVNTANTYLGHEYTLTGEVVKGNKIGNQLGFPTANIHIKEDYKLIPADGAYAAKAIIKGVEHYGMMNIGIRPTVDGSKRVIEIHLFDFNEVVYGETVQLKLVEHLRPEKKFDSVELLKEQLQRDNINAKNIFGLL